MKSFPFAKSPIVDFYNFWWLLVKHQLIQLKYSLHFIYQAASFSLIYLHEKNVVLFIFDTFDFIMDGLNTSNNIQL